MSNFKTLEWHNDKLILVDCTKLPAEEKYISCQTYEDLAFAIKKLIVRGAPAIGVAAAYGAVLSAQQAISRGLKKDDFYKFIIEGIRKLALTRPTAVNLFWALNRMEVKLNQVRYEKENEIRDLLLEEAKLIHEEDIECCRKIGCYGNQIVAENSNILTHCNAGALATTGIGTALGVIRTAQSSGKNIHVYSDETRPLLQGARMTAWELLKDNIPVTLITDNMAGYLMKLKKINLVIVGADRIAANGDTANKIGTYSAAVLAKEHGIPFFIAAPKSTIDISLKSGDEINIEERDKDEVRNLFGTRIAPSTVDTFNPAFDVTPHNYITGIITEKGILREPYEISIKEIFEI